MCIRDSVIPDGIPALSDEVMSTLGWEKYSHEQFGLNRFGASGPYKEVYAVRDDKLQLFRNDANHDCRNSSSLRRASPSALFPPSSSTRTSSPFVRLSTVLSCSSFKRCCFAMRREGGPEVQIQNGTLLCISENKIEHAECKRDHDTASLMGWCPHVHLSSPCVGSVSSRGGRPRDVLLGLQTASLLLTAI